MCKVILNLLLKMQNLFKLKRGFCRWLILLKELWLKKKINMKKEKIVSPKNFIQVISQTFTLIMLLLFLFYFIKIMLWVQLHKSQNKKLNPNFDKFKNVWTHKIMEHHKWWW